MPRTPLAMMSRVARMPDEASGKGSSGSAIGLPFEMTWRCIRSFLLFANAFFVLFVYSASELQVKVQSAAINHLVFGL